MLDRVAMIRQLPTKLELDRLRTELGDFTAPEGDDFVAIRELGIEQELLQIAAGVESVPGEAEVLEVGLCVFDGVLGWEEELIRDGVADAGAVLKP